MVNTVDIQVYDESKPSVHVTYFSSDSENSLAYDVSDEHENLDIHVVDEQWLDSRDSTMPISMGSITLRIEVSNDYAGLLGEFFVTCESVVYYEENKLAVISLEVHDYNIHPYPFIYDRTQADVDLVKSLHDKWFNGTLTDEEYGMYNFNNLKGALNRYDLGRIEVNMAYISEKLDLGLTTHYDKDSQTVDIPHVYYTEYFDDLKNNVTAIYNSNNHYPDTPKVPALPFNTYQKLNAIEKILYDTYIHIVSDEQNLVFAGEMFCGESVPDTIMVVPNN